MLHSSLKRCCCFNYRYYSDEGSQNWPSYQPVVQNAIDALLQTERRAADNWEPCYNAIESLFKFAHGLSDGALVPPISVQPTFLNTNTPLDNRQFQPPSYFGTVHQSRSPNPPPTSNVDVRVCIDAPATQLRAQRDVERTEPNYRASPTPPSSASHGCPRP